MVCSASSIYCWVPRSSPLSSPAFTSFFQIAKSLRGSNCFPRSAANWRKNSFTPRNRPCATLVAIVLTSLYLIFSNRKIFARIELLSAQRSELAQKLIHAQESTLRHISRELHDEFGQVLTAIGVLL